MQDLALISLATSNKIGIISIDQGAFYEIFEKNSIIPDPLEYLLLRETSLLLQEAAAISWSIEAIIRVVLPGKDRKGFLIHKN